MPASSSPTSSMGDRTKNEPQRKSNSWTAVSTIEVVASLAIASGRSGRETCGAQTDPPSETRDAGSQQACRPHSLARHSRRSGEPAPVPPDSRRATTGRYGLGYPNGPSVLSLPHQTGVGAARPNANRSLPRSATTKPGSRLPAARARSSSLHRPPSWHPRIRSQSPVGGSGECIRTPDS